MGYWQIKGSRADLSIGVSESGVLSWTGNGVQSCRSTSFEYDSSAEERAHLNQIQAAASSWTIVSTTGDEMSIDSAGDGLFARVQASLGQSHGKIRYYDGSHPLVGFTIVVPPSKFAHMCRALELVIQSTDLLYGISMGFDGFRVPKAETETPTSGEFMKGRPYFPSDISLWVSPPRQG